MTNEEEKKLSPNVYGGAYDQQINDLYGQYTNRSPFEYNVNTDALYQQYRDKYVQNAKRSMKDTMGQAAGLTGGYGSTYSQGVGQQQYDENMRSLTDVIPELSDRAYQQYQDQGDQILTQYNLANQLGAADQATRQYNQEWEFNQKQYNDQQAQQAYANLSTAILQSGYVPSEDELAAAGMTSAQANALRQAWIGSNPNLAYMSGAITADQYYQLTGKYAPGAAPAATGGGGGGYTKPNSKSNKETNPQYKDTVMGFIVDNLNGKNSNNKVYTASDITNSLGSLANTKAGNGLTYKENAEYLELMKNRKDI